MSLTATCAPAREKMRAGSADIGSGSEHDSNFVLESAGREHGGDLDAVAGSRVAPVWGCHRRSHLSAVRTNAVRAKDDTPITAGEGEDAPDRFASALPPLLRRNGRRLQHSVAAPAIAHALAAGQEFPFMRA